MGFVGVFPTIHIPSDVSAPQLREALYHPRDWLGFLLVGTEIPALRVARSMFIEFLRKKQIASQRFEHMLPGTNSFWVTNRCFPMFERCPHQIGNQPVAGPIAAADHVARSRRCNGHSSSLARVEKK